MGKKRKNDLLGSVAPPQPASSPAPATAVTEPANAKPPRLVHKRELLDRVGVSYPTIWNMMRAGTFPRSRQAGGQKICWLESEIEAWITSRPVQPLKGDEAA